MAVYSVEGKLGTGKTKFAVWRAQEAFRDGRRIASNVDLFLGEFTRNRKGSFTRIPDKPTARDLEAMGHGNPDSYDEDRNGVLILDELGTWLNSRSFQDRERAFLLDWLIHARKHGWDVYLIVQDATMIDKQVREALIEYACRCVRVDKIKVPVLGSVIRDVAAAFGARGRWGYLPRFHMVSARLGQGPNAVVTERWAYRGDWLHSCYDTRQVFRGDYPHGCHTVLHPAYFEPEPPKPPGLLSRLWLAAFGPPAPVLAPPPAPKLLWVQRVQRLPEHRRIPALRTLGLIGD